MITITIDDKKIETTPDTSVLEVALAKRIDIAGLNNLV
jgi:NADH dehydrogenase/NADH:ubiquinone oxidoreductase subunit G